MRAYAIHRPIGPFTWPSEYRDQVMDIVNYDTLTYVEKIGRNAFGHIDFAVDVPKDALDRYELVTDPMEDEKLVTIGKFLAECAQKEDWDRFDRGWGKAKAKYGYSDDQIERMMDRFGEKVTK